MNNVKERILFFIKHKNLSQRKFETLCQLSNGYINNIRQSISPSKLQNIALHFPELNTAWLITGEGDMLKDESGSPETRRENPINRGVPFFDIDFIDRFDAISTDSNDPDYYIDFRPYNRADYWVNVTGHSMEPYICHGDMVAIKKISDWKDFLLFGETYAIVTREFRTIRVITQADAPGMFKLVPLNSNGLYTPQEIPKESILQIFAVYGNMKRHF